MSMDKAVASCFKKYAVFKGRATRLEFWSFFLFEFLLGILGLIPFVQFAAGIISLLCIIPEIAVSVRRLHDTGKSGWWFLFPFLGLLAYIPIFFSGASDFEDVIASALIWVIIGSLLVIIFAIVLLVSFSER